MWQHSEECMCRLRNIAMRDYQESVTTRQTHRRTDRHTDAGQSDPYVPLCFAGDKTSSWCCGLYSVFRHTPLNFNRFIEVLPPHCNSITRH